LRSSCITPIARGGPLTNSSKKHVLRPGSIQPNVVRVYNAEVHDGEVGVWMELIDGVTLETEVRQKQRFDAEMASEVGEAVCDALSPEPTDFGILGVPAKDYKPPHSFRWQFLWSL